MTCREAQECIPWVPAGALEPSEQARLLRHTMVCSGCRKQLAEAFAEQRLSRAAWDALPGLRSDAWARLEGRLPTDERKPASRIAGVRALLARLGVPASPTDALGLAERLRNEGLRIGLPPLLTGLGSLAR